jgi:hypothetical protein
MLIVPNTLETFFISHLEAFFRASNIRTKFTASSQSVSGPEIVKILRLPPSWRVEATEKVVATESLEAVRMAAPLFSPVLVLSSIVVPPVVETFAEGGGVVIRESLARLPFQEMIYSPISSSLRLAWQKGVSFGELIKVTNGQRCFGIKNSSPWMIGILLVVVLEVSVTLCQFQCPRTDPLNGK